MQHLLSESLKISVFASRWWEARKMWGQLLNITRNLVRQVCSESSYSRACHPRAQLPTLSNAEWTVKADSMRTTRDSFQVQGLLTSRHHI